MKGWKIKCLTKVGEKRLRQNMSKDPKVVITTVSEEPLVVSFVYNKRAFSMKEKLMLNFASERAVKVAIQDYMNPAVVDVDFVVEVLK